MTRNNHLIRNIILIALIMCGLSLSLMLLTKTREYNNRKMTIDVDTMKLVQLDPPQEGDPVAIVDTTIGEVRFRLYPEYSPEAVRNFVELAESGYYDGTYVFDAMNGAYASMGAPNKDGSLNVSSSSSQERIKRELNQDLWPFRGTVCLFNNTFKRTFKQYIFGGGTYYCGSRFTMLNSVLFNDEFKQEIRESSVSSELAEAFIEKGGIPNYSQQFTIIGQTYQGLDVVDALASLPSRNDGEHHVPLEEVKINSVKIDTYHAADAENGTEQK
ncbi:MAG: peptidylprolyl isomerase [Ruminococcus sp.]|nr:peptidylprolyl isomerase [Ruminococcus sp.]